MVTGAAVGGTTTRAQSVSAVEQDGSANWMAAVWSSQKDLIQCDREELNGQGQQRPSIWFAVGAVGDETMRATVSEKPGNTHAHCVGMRAYACGSVQSQKERTMVVHEIIHLYIDN